MADSDRPETEEPSTPEAPVAPPASGEGAGAPAPAEPAGATTPVRATPVEQPKMGAFARVLTVFVSPGAVFTDIARKPTVVVALVVLTVIGTGASISSMRHVDVGATVREMLTKNPRTEKMGDAAIDRMATRAEKGKYVRASFSVVIIPAFMAFVALVFFLGAKLLGSDIGYVPTLSVVAHAFVPAEVVGAVIGFVVLSRVGVVTGQAARGLVKSNLGAFLPHTAPWYLHALAAPLDVFTLWGLALVALGIGVVAKLSRSRAIGLVVVVFLLYVGLRLGFAGIGHAFGG